VSSIDYKHLREIAEASTRGDWVSFVPCGAAVNPSGAAFLAGPPRRTMDRSEGFRPEDAQHIAAFRPDVALALLDRVEALEAQLKAQARAALAGMDAATRASSIRLELAEKARAESSPEALASERAANAILTEENERLRAALEAERQPWISVSDGLPEIRALAFTPTDNRLIQHRIIPGGMFRQIAKEATHWMPLPSNPPKVPA
jgi:hypothetical protein